jgi:hypothetical protein
MMDDILSLQRRSFLQQSAGAVALAGVSAGVKASGAALASNQPKAIVLYQPHDEASVAYALQQQAAGMATLALSNDVVRQWRDQLQALVINEGYRLHGRTAYADYFMLRGLAAEHRLHTQPEQQYASGSFDWVI